MIAGSVPIGRIVADQSRARTPVCERFARVQGHERPRRALATQEQAEVVDRVFPEAVAFVHGRWRIRCPPRVAAGVSSRDLPELIICANSNNNNIHSDESW